jgi:hypothetical protein
MGADPRRPAHPPAAPPGPRHAASRRLVPRRPGHGGRHAARRRPGRLAVAALAAAAARVVAAGRGRAWTLGPFGAAELARVCAHLRAQRRRRHAERTAEHLADLRRRRDRPGRPEPGDADAPLDLDGFEGLGPAARGPASRLPRRPADHPAAIAAVRRLTGPCAGCALRALDPAWRPGRPPAGDPATDQPPRP